MSISHLHERYLAIQTLAVEEAPLWEILQDVNFTSSENIADRLSDAVAIVTDLLNSGKIELVWSKWTTDRVEQRVASADENKKIVADVRYWIPSSRYEQYVELRFVQ